MKTWKGRAEIEQGERGRRDLRVSGEQRIERGEVKQSRKRNRANWEVKARDGEKGGEKNRGVGEGLTQRLRKGAERKLESKGRARD